MKLNAKELATFGMLGALMYASKLAMEALPNVHLLAVFTVSMTAVYRKKALYPIYVYAILCGLFAGFNTWWVPHLYLWTLLWGAVMLLPKSIPPKVLPIVYSCLCALHGFLYGTLYAPVQALFYGLSFEATIAWIVSGLPWDVVHGVGNLICSLLVMPFITVFKRTEKYLV